MPDHEVMLEERLASLEDASRLLSTEVTSLNSTLIIVADLQKQQRAQAERQTKTEAAIVATRQAAVERDRRTRNAVRAIVIGLSLILPIVAILVYASLVQHVNELLSNQKQDRYNSCLVRNSATAENVRRESVLAELEPNKDIKLVHQQSALILQKGLVNCSPYKPKK